MFDKRFFISESILITGGPVVRIRDEGTPDCNLGQKYHSNRGYSHESLHHVFQSNSLEFSRYGSDNDKIR